jgi:hypothetical protein
MSCRCCRGRSVSRLACPCGVFSGGVDRCDRGSSGCLAPEGRPVRPLCPRLRVPRAGCFRDRGSPGADIATFDPRSRNSPVMVVGLFCFMVVRRRPEGCSPAMTRGLARTAGRPAGDRPGYGQAGSGAPVRSGTQTAANAGLLPDRSIASSTIQDLIMEIAFADRVQTLPQTRRVPRQPPEGRPKAVSVERFYLSALRQAGSLGDFLAAFRRSAARNLPSGPGPLYLGLTLVFDFRISKSRSGAGEAAVYVDGLAGDVVAGR